MQVHMVAEMIIQVALLDLYKIQLYFIQILLYISTFLVVRLQQDLLSTNLVGSKSHAINIQILSSYILYKYYPSLYYISTFLVGQTSTIFVVNKSCRKKILCYNHTNIVGMKKYSYILYKYCRERTSCKITLVAFVWLFSTVHVRMCSQFSCVRGCIITLVALVCHLVLTSFCPSLSEIKN